MWIHFFAITRSGLIALVLVTLLNFTATASALPFKTTEDHKSATQSVNTFIPASMVDGRVLFDVRQEMIGRPFLIWKRYPATPLASLDHQIAQWELRGSRVVLVALATYKGSSLPMERAGGRHEIGDYNVVSTTIEFTRSIDVTKLFSEGDLVRWDLSDSQQGSRPIEIGSVRSYVDNTVVYASRDVTGKSQGNDQVVWNFLRLADKPMSARELDRRMGFDFLARKFPKELNYVSGPRAINRWRLSDGDVSKQGVTVDRPIHIYVDPRTPKAWRPWVIEGIEAWQPAFEAAGFKNAIVAVDPDDDPNFSFDDVRVSAICWPTKEAILRKMGSCGWRVHDPRTGEALQYQIGGPSNSVEMLRRYAVTMAAVDKRITGQDEVGSLDDVLGGLIRRVTSHESGHILGLRDGNFGKYAYSVEQVRSSEWIERMGFTPSVMNYTRFNFVAQPEDNLAEKYLMQDIGPADVHSILWGYSIPDLDPFDSDILSKIELTGDAQVDKRMLSFTEPSNPNGNPATTLEAVEVTDPLAAAELGLRNLNASMRLIAKADLTSRDKGIQSQIGHRQLFLAAVEQWQYIVQPVASLIGATVVLPGSEASLDAEIAIPESQQRAAMRFVCNQILSDEPYRLLRNDLMTRAGVSEEELEQALTFRQTTVLLDIFQPKRLTDLTRLELAALSGQDGYGILEIFGELRQCPIDERIRHDLKKRLEQ